MKARLNYILKVIYKHTKSFLYNIIIRCSLLFNKKTYLFEEDKIVDLNTYWKKKKTSCFLDKKRVCDNPIYDLCIIIPLFNSSSFMEKCILSLINQKTKYKYQIILVNDGSTDDTLKIAKEYENQFSNILVINQKNGGCAVARNSGLDKASAKYVGFIDSDDYVDDNYIELLMNTAFDNNAEIVKCGYDEVSDGIKLYEDTKQTANYNDGMNDFIFNFKSFVWAAVYRYDLFCDIQFPSGYWYEDMIARFLLFRKANTFNNIQNVLYHKMSHKNNISKMIWKSKNNRFLEHLYLIEILIDDSKKLHLKDDQYFYLCILLECSNIMSQRSSMLEEKVQKEIFRQAQILLKNNYKIKYQKYLSNDWKIKKQIFDNSRFDLWKMLKNIY